jgi:hypothetical protein
MIILKDIIKIGCDFVDLIHKAQERDQCGAAVSNTVTDVGLH